MGGHLPVLVERVLDLLGLRPGARILDATVGLGGHAEAILGRIGPGGLLLGADADAEMLKRAGERLARFGPAVKLVHAPFSTLREVVRREDLDPLDGVLLDLGVCSAQLDDPSRGFRFGPSEQPVPLDMRLDRSRPESAADLIERTDEAELAEILRQGDVPGPVRVARAIRAARPIR